MSTNSVRLLAALALTSLPLAAVAQSATPYTPPQLTKPGSSTTAAAGAGAVTVQVFVKKDGSFTVTRVLKTTNAGNNAAALETAKSAAYKPGTRSGKAVDAYYDYTMTFTGAGVVTGADTTGPTASAYAAIRAGKYDVAKAQLTTYLQAHPGDAQASTLLGVADAFGGDSAGAAQAFDSVPSIPAQYRTLATQAYTKDAMALLNANKNAEAIAATGRIIALDPTYIEGYYLRGIANSNQQNFQAALPDLQKAFDLAKASKADDKTLANIEFQIAVVQFNTGAYDAGVASAKDVTRLDPSQGPKLTQAGYVAIANEAVALANAGKATDAEAKFDQGATLFPSRAGDFYGESAFIMLTEKTPDYKKAGAEAGKALAVDPTNGRALFVNAFVAAQSSDTKTAIADMTKAKASPLYSSDPNFAKQVDDNLKKLSASTP